MVEAVLLLWHYNSSRKLLVKESRGTRLTVGGDAWRCTRVASIDVNLTSYSYTRDHHEPLPTTYSWYVALPVQSKNYRRLTAV
jgi:hypothetical protein